MKLGTSHLIKGRKNDSKLKEDASTQTHSENSIESKGADGKADKVIFDLQKKEDEDLRADFAIMKQKFSKMEKDILFLTHKVEKLSSSLMNIQLRGYIKDIVNILYKEFLKEKDFIKLIKKKEISFLDQIWIIKDFIKSKYKAKKETRKEKLINGLLKFFENIQKSKILGDDLAHPHQIGKIILPEYALKKLKKEKNEYSICELIIDIFNDSPEIESNLQKLMNNIDILSFGRYDKNLKDILADYFEDNAH